MQIFEIIPQIGALLGLLKLFAIVSWLNERKFEKSITKEDEIKKDE